MTTLFAFLATLAILIVFHEFGHYLVARLSGIKVLRFSVGFGPVVARRIDRHETEWALSAIPLGGYVKMLDEREAPVPPAWLDRAFNRQSLAIRSAVVAAGPLANLLLAILLFWTLFMAGVPTLKPVLGDPPPDTPAAKVGIRAGDRVARVADEAVESFENLHWLVLKHGIGQHALTLEIQDSTGRTLTRTLSLQGLDERFEQEPLLQLGLVRFLPRLEPILGELQPDGAGSRAGLHAGDRILAIDGQPLGTWDEAVTRIRKSPGRTLDFLVAGREGERHVSVVPDAVDDKGLTIGRIGASPWLDETLKDRFMTETRYGPLQAFGKALDRTWALSTFSLEMMARMVVGQVSIKNLSGPITIADYAGQSASIGWSSFIAFLALVSISLGVLNLLPIPLLDGGHLLYYFVEFVTGRPVSQQVQEIGQKIGIGLLSLLMFFALYNDLQRLFAG